MLDDFADAHCNFFATLDHILEQAGADDLAQGGLSAFDERLTDVGNGKGGPVGLVDVVVYHRGTLLNLFLANNANILHS